MKKFILCLGLLIPGLLMGQVSSEKNTISVEKNGGLPIPSGYLTIQDEGVALPQESILNCVGANITCSDDSAHGRTLLTISGAGGSTFDTIGSGTNTTAAMVVGTGASLATSGSGSITASAVKASSVTYPGLQNETNATFLGNSSGGAAAPSEQTVTAPLSLSGGALSIAATTTNDGGTIVKQATTPGTQQGSAGTANININGTSIQELDNLAATATAGTVTQNLTAATSGVPVQVSPSIQLIGQGWNTGGTPATNQDIWSIQNQPVSGNPTTSNLRFLSSINGAANTLAGSFSSAGLLSTANATFSGSAVTIQSGNGLVNETGTMTGTGGLQWAFQNSGATLITGNRLVSASCTSGTTCDSTTNIPANAVVLSVAYRITTAVTGATTIELGTATNATAFCTGLTTLTVNTTGVCGGGATVGAGVNGAAVALRATATAGTFTAGVIEYNITYILVTPPTS